MLEVYFTENTDVYVGLDNILSRLLRRPFKILRTVNGKPYIEGDPLFFSISHSKDRAVIAVCDRPVGADIEVLTERKYQAVLSRFTQAEKAEISCTEDFLKHWTVREAYVKMLGSTLAHKLNRLSFIGGTLFDGGRIADCELSTGCKDGCVYSICIAN